MLPENPLLVRCSATGAKVYEDGLPEAKPTYPMELANRKLFLEFARLAWFCYLADGINVKAISIFKKLVALTKPEMLTGIAAMEIFLTLEARLSLNLAMLNNKKGQFIDNLVEVEEESEKKVGFIFAIHTFYAALKNVGCRKVFHRLLSHVLLS